MNFPHSKQKLVSALFFLQLPQLISLPSPLCCTARTPSRLFCRKPVGNLSKLSGTPTWAWHSGQRNCPCCWVVRACLFKHSQQKVCRHVIVLGSVKVSKQIEHVTCSFTFFKRNSIANAKRDREIMHTQLLFIIPRNRDLFDSRTDQFLPNLVASKQRYLWSALLHDRSSSCVIYLSLPSSQEESSSKCEILWKGKVYNASV